jgi:hypothetical protein
MVPADGGEGSLDSQVMHGSRQDMKLQLEIGWHSSQTSDGKAFRQLLQHLQHSQQARYKHHAAFSEEYYSNEDCNASFYWQAELSLYNMRWMLFTVFQQQMFLSSIYQRKCCVKTSLNEFFKIARSERGVLKNERKRPWIWQPEDCLQTSEHHHDGTMLCYAMLCFAYK